MITNTNKGFEMQGEASEIMTDLTLIVRNINTVFQEQLGLTEADVKEIVKRCFDMAFRSDAEVIKESLDRLKKTLDENPDKGVEDFKKVFGFED